MKTLSFLLPTTILFFSINLSAAEVPSGKKDRVLSEAQEKQEKAEPSTLDKVSQTAQDTTEQIAEKMAQTRERRSKADYFALGNYSLVDLLIPGKYGITLGLIQDVDKTWEFEYVKGSLSVPFLIEDLGKMSDERFSIIARSYSGNNSFNFSYGISYFDFSLHLGDKLLNRVTGGGYPSLDLVELQSFGFNLAIGNRWTFNQNMTLSVDWISWSQPVLITNRKSIFLDYANNQQDRDDVDKAIKYISYFPRLAFLKLQFGILF